MTTTWADTPERRQIDAIIQDLFEDRLISNEDVPSFRFMQALLKRYSLEPKPPISEEQSEAEETETIFELYGRHTKQETLLFEGAHVGSTSDAVELGKIMNASPYRFFQIWKNDGDGTARYLFGEVEIPR